MKGPVAGWLMEMLLPGARRLSDNDPGARERGLEASPLLLLGAEDSTSPSGHPRPVCALHPGMGPLHPGMCCSTSIGVREEVRDEPWASQGREHHGMGAPWL